MKFISLHTHTSFSYGDGHKLPEDHVKRVKDLGMDAMALTEHGNTSSHVQFEKAAQKHGIKPIFGVEAYVAPPNTKAKFHQTILAMNENGYRQLNRLVTRSYSEGFFHYPTIHQDWLLDPELTSDMILLSGCADSWLSCTLAGGKSLGDRLVDTVSLDDQLSELLNAGKDEAYDRLVDAVYERFQDGLSLAKTFQEVYGDRYYLEVQLFDNYARTRYLNQKIEEIHRETGIPIVATADVHYPHPEDWEIQRLSNAIQWKKSVDDLAKNRDYEAGKAAYPLSDQEVVQRLRATGLADTTIKAAILNTREVAARCNVTLPKTSPVRYSESDGTDQEAQRILKKRIMEGIAFRKETSDTFAKDFAEREDEYKARVKKELDVILPKGFSDYFLVNEQVIGWAKNNGIAVGPGRGSAASSLICYLLRLTEINPIEFPQMVFERFLDPGREDDPDIDTDYQDDRRNEVFEYMREIYGDENVGNIGNFSRFRGRTAVKSAGKALQVPFSDTETFANLIGTPAFGDPREFDSAEDAAASFEEAGRVVMEYPDMKLAYRLEGDMRGLGIHAAGMVISNNPISETCAIYRRKKSNGDEAEVIAYDKRDAGYLKMLKLDCLGLLTMTIVAHVIDMVDELDLDVLYNLPRDDEKVLKAFADDDLTGIFQFEGRSTRGIVKDIFLGKNRTPTFMQLADINALSRPGSLSSGMTRQYISVENGGSRKSIHPVVDEILGETNGCLVYQEQVMKIGSQFGGLDDSEIGRLRKIIGAKQAGGAFDAFWAKFRDGAKKLHGAEESKAKEVWDYMAASASYLFNVSHAISYALVAYWTMYLKVYYPAEFFAASLRSAAKKGKQKGKADPQLLLLQDAAAHGLTISPPTIFSEVSWSPNEERTGLQAGFTQIPRVGERLAIRMIETREESSLDREAQAAKGWDLFVEDTPGFGEKAKETAMQMQQSLDPFDINLTNDATYSVIQAIEEGFIPLSHPDATSASIPKQEGEYVTYIGHVVTVKIIDHLAEMRQRENLTQQEILDKVDSPELAIKAKIICADPGGTEVHVNVSRFRYPNLADEISEIQSKGVYVVHAEGIANAGFGPAVQAHTLTTIQLEE
ncbi:DNA polymerase III alpha subunit [Corynebacterium phage Darwin]|uniref:DNA polymerase III alpha subunit n=1 Tax=Corynebacterium phage Darwin TaxID=2047869 RepID=A0A2H4P8P6_9CAUD|nr:DNA polymerase [Corynebacterium phage Darwin]ATW58597.1 DNA polymerase III alpha subunit [Corynebacterium phage Darwin]